MCHSNYFLSCKTRSKFSTFLFFLSFYCYLWIYWIACMHILTSILNFYIHLCDTVPSILTSMKVVNATWREFQQKIFFFHDFPLSSTGKHFFLQFLKSFGIYFKRISNFYKLFFLLFWRVFWLLYVGMKKLSVKLLLTPHKIPYIYLKKHFLFIANIGKGKSPINYIFKIF